MKWFMLMISFIFRKFTPRAKSLREVAVEIFEELSFKSRRLVSLILTGLASVFFFCGGVFISLLTATSQYESMGIIYFTPTLASGLVLIGISGISFALIFLRAWPGARKLESIPIESKSETLHSSGLEQALSALVMDYIQERQERRATPPTTEKTSHKESVRPQPRAPQGKETNSRHIH